MKKTPVHGLDAAGAANGAQMVVRDGTFSIEPPFGVALIILEHGQTISAWMSAHGVTEIPEDTAIIELSA